MIRIILVHMKQPFVYPKLGPDDWKIEHGVIVISQKSSDRPPRRENIAAFSVAHLEWLQVMEDQPEPSGLVLPGPGAIPPS